MRKHKEIWTKAEEEIALNNQPKIAAALLGRTLAAVVVRRYILRHPTPPSPNRYERFTALDLKRLKKLYATGDRKDLLEAFPKFDWGQIQRRARTLGLKRKFLGTADIRIKGHGELIDQIRIRAKEDGIALCRLDKILKTGTYFAYNSMQRINRRANLRAVANAIEFFGGILVIDWQDRPLFRKPGTDIAPI
jgi:hypothetical protein